MKAIVVLMLLASVSRADTPAKCFANLCGMDTACWCHEAGKERRCWSQSEDCEADLACCASTRSCRTTPYLAETCGKRTSDARKRRDAERRAPSPSPSPRGR